MIHEQLRKSPKVQEALKRAEDALVDFENAGGEVYADLHEKYLSVNVKTNVFEYPPEIKDDDEIRHRLWEKEAEDFWQFDMSEDDFRAVVLGTTVYHFPKVYGAGRSGGHLIFDRKVNRGQHETIIRAIYENRTIEEELSTGDLWRFADDEWEVTDDTSDIDDAVSEIIQELEYATAFLQDATKWVKHVVACKKYHEDNLRGAHFGYLNGLCDIEDFEIFALDHCTAVIDGDDVTVSWPQHARVFEDAGEWVDCDEFTPGAQPWGAPDDEDGNPVPQKYVTWVQKQEPTAFSFKVSLDDFIDAVNEDIAEARRLMSR